MRMSCKRRGRAKQFKPGAKEHFFLGYRPLKFPDVDSPLRRGWKRLKRLADLLCSAKRFSLSYKFCTSFLVVPVFSPPIRSPFYCVKLSWGLNYPSPLWLEELHANRKAVALQWLAVCNTARGTKLSSARGEYQGFAWLPAARTHHASATRAHIFSKSRFGARRVAMTVDQNGDFHRDTAFGSVKRKSLRVRHGLAHPHRHAAMRVRF